MVWIHTIDPENATGRLAEAYGWQAHRLGRPTEFTQLGSLDADVVHARLVLYRASENVPSRLSVTQKLLISYLTSILNATPHCASLARTQLCAPGAEMVPADSDSIASASELMASGREARTSGDDTPVSGGETRVSGGETRFPGDDTRCSGSDTRVSRGKTRVSGGEALVAALDRRDYAALDPADGALARYVEKLTLRPGDMSAEDVADLRAAGFNDLDILDANNQCAHLNYTNRVANGLGLLSDARADERSPDRIPQ